MTERIDTVIFDLGNVLIAWDPCRLYRRLIPDDAEREWFLAEVCNAEWNERQDAGRSWAEGIAELCVRHPRHAALIQAYREHWTETLDGAIEDSVALLAELKARGVRLLALTNWSQETFPLARERFAFLGWFEGIVVSGEEGLVKPDPRLYRLLLERYSVQPARALFVDDAPRNVAGAEAVGLHARLFQGAAQFRRQLVELGLLD